MAVFNSILNASVPLIFLILFGYIVALTNVIDPKHYSILVNLVIQIFFPMTIIYNLAVQQLTPKDFLVILSQVAGTIGIMPFMILLTLPYKNKKNIFAQIFSCTNISNILLSGIQITSGFYDEQEVIKYAYIQSFGQCIF